MAPTGMEHCAESSAVARRPSSNNRVAEEEDSLRDEFAKDLAAAEELEDRDDKSWRTRGESSPCMVGIASPRSLGDQLPPRSWDSAMRSLKPPLCPERRKRQLFWRNVVRQYNFVDQEGERELVLSLTQGIDWASMEMLPRKFMARHKELYHLICRADYERSSMIQRDVTRTFSIFEQSQLPTRERDVNAQQRSLFRVLNAVAEAEDGYCQGMNFIAALFLVEGLDEEEAYALFVYLLKKRQLARIYHHSSTFLDDYLRQFELMLRAELPDLYAHMQEQGFAIPMYGIEWFTTLFSLSTKPDLACAIFDLFFVGVQDIFLRIGLAILKLLEAPLMCMSFEDFLRDFKPLVRQIDPYLAVFQALSFKPNPHVAPGEDTTAHIARQHYQHSADRGNVTTTEEGRTVVSPPRTFLRHRSLPPELAFAIEAGDFSQVSSLYLSMSAYRAMPLHWLVLANEILHFAVWHGQVAIACFAIRQCGAGVDNADDTGLRPLHFAVIRNQPDLVRLLLCCGADPSSCGGRWSGSTNGLTPLETSLNWKFQDTTAARLVLECEVCLCCNRRLSAFAFHSEFCRKCKFTFCGRGSQPCIQRHQCPAKHREWRHQQDQLYELDRDHLSQSQEDESVITGSDTVEVTQRSTTENGSAPSSSTSRRSSRSVSSETSSSFVYIHSPASDLPLDQAIGDTTTTATNASTTGTDSTLTNTGFFNPFVDWFSGGVSTASNSLDDGMDSVDLQSGIDFPDRPKWYCNAPRCHAVFSFFSRRDECMCCGGYFCSADFDPMRRCCHRCCERHDKAGGTED